MPTPFKGKVAETMDTPGARDQSIGDKIAEARAGGKAINKGGLASIHDHMDVVSMDGTKIGVVDQLEGNAIKLTKNDSPDGKHHFLPVAWVDHVDSQVHICKTPSEAARDWKDNAVSCNAI